MSKVGTVRVHVGENNELVAMSAFVRSKAIIHISWFPSGRLRVMFWNNTKDTYVYHDVPAEIWNELVNAESVGKKFNEIVKDKFTFTV